MRVALNGNPPAPAPGQTHIAEWVTEPTHEWIAPLHVHHECDEAWYVLEGAMVFRIGDEDLSAQAGDYVFAPKGAAHTYRNAGTGAARYLIFMTAQTHDLIAAIHSGSGKPIADVFKDHQAEFLGFPSEGG